MGRRYLNLRELLWIVCLPLSYLWAAYTYFRRRRFPVDRAYRSSLPVLSVGNIHSGGSGKTPMVMAIARHFADRRPVILSRGYGGKLSRKGARVSLDNPVGALNYGDEPWMMAQLLGAPVYIGADRAALAREIEKKHPGSLVILDDGFQHRKLARRWDLVLVNTGRPLADSFCLPLGDLREPLYALGAATAVILVRGEDAQSHDLWHELLATRFPGVRVFTARKAAAGVWEGETEVALEPGTVFGAFCGIAEPASFFTSMQAVGSPVFLQAFADHHLYTSEDVSGLIGRMDESGAGCLVTTDKDWFKVRKALASAGRKVFSLRIHYEISNDFWYYLESLLESP